MGYGTTAFTSLTIGVHNGVVTLGGTVYWPPDKDSALGLVANTPGVKDIVDNIEVAPVSPMDDRLRLRVGARDLRDAGVAEVCDRPGEADSDHRGQRQCNA